jgi:hypothetical protein
MGLLMSLTACTKRETPPPAKPARISATTAYEKYFGPAPTTDKGTCYAFVIYFPSAKSPGKVVPFPFFSFDEGSLKKVAVERLMGGMAVPAYKDEIRQPLAPGAHLLALSEADGVVKIDLSREFLTSSRDSDGMVNALVLTLSQFEGVKGVRLLADGMEPDFAKGTLLPVAASVLAPSSPRLLSVTAVKDKESQVVEEVSVYFDRPVEIRQVTMADGSGKPFAGEVFLSVFDMAAVLKPKDPSLFRAGMPVKVLWKVTDKRGRMADGEGDFPLEVKEH